MQDKVKSAKRMLELQKHLHSIEELKYVRLKQEIDRCQEEEQQLMATLSSDDALHGLFFDMRVRRVNRLRLEADRLEPQLKERARVVAEHGGRVRNTEKFVATLEVEQRRADERAELEAVLEVSLAKSSASLKQDQ